MPERRVAEPPVLDEDDEEILDEIWDNIDNKWEPLENVPLKTPQRDSISDES